MNPAIDKLIKFFRLEVDRGYDDRAVVGGLQRMLEPWQMEAREMGLPEPLIDIVSSRLGDYSRLSPMSRQDTLAGLMRRIREEFPDLPEIIPQAEESPKSPTEDIGQDTAAVATVEAPEMPSSEIVDEIITEQPASPESTSATSETLQPTVEVEEVSPEKEEPPAALGAPLTTIQGIGPKSAKTLKKLNVETLGDLLWHLPRRYDDYSELKTINRLWFGEEVTIIGTVEESRVRVVRGGKMKLVEAVVSDGTGSLRVTWFNQPWIADRLKAGRAVVLSGKVDQYLGKLTMNSPEWELLERKQLHTNRIVPVYPLTAGVSSKWLRRVIHSVITRLAPRIADPLPDSIRRSAGLLPLNIAVQQAHFPDNWETLSQAQQRLAFDEMLLLQLGVLRQKREWDQLESLPLVVDDFWMTRFVEALPYSLTEAQQKALKDVRSDLAAPHPMNRLLQGDVGSGKTVIAAAAIAIATEGGSQSAIMAPTSILAEQHYQTLISMLSEAASIPSERIGLLLGSTPEAEKEFLRKGIADGSVQVLVGTHALLEDPVTFSQLGLVVIDEQHRFGVQQRAVLREKGDNPNLLVMTATPIPRSLALTVYGDLDLTVIGEMPPGRIPTETRIIRSVERGRAYQFISGQLEAGHQAFIIYPLVEGSEKVQAKAAVDEHERLQEEVFKRYKVGLLHGRMRPDEKDDVMTGFRTGEYDVLVSTSVIEVGVDIPNATVMLIEGADRFGLAQLHQFRGRVGRGTEGSFCLLIPTDDDKVVNERLSAMEATNDGFKLAELDLEQRGPGDFLGTRQSGFAELRTAEITDVKLIEQARREAKTLFEVDPELQASEHALLSQELNRFWITGKGEIS